MTLEVDRDKIEAGLRQAVYPNLVKSDPQELVIDGDTQVPIVMIFVFLEDEVLDLKSRIFLEILYADPRVRLDWVLTFAPSDDWIHVVPAVAVDDHGHVVILACKFNFSSVPLVIVSMCGQESVWINTNFAANAVDLTQHV